VNRALRAAAMGALLLTPVALSACSAGQVAQTAEQNRDRFGGTAAAGDIAIRNAQLAYPVTGAYQKGGDARLLVAIANGGQTDDTLVSIEGEAFDGVEVTGLAAPAAGSTTPAPAAGSTTPAPAAGSTTPAPAAGSTTPAPAAGSTTPAPAAGSTTPAPAAGSTTPAPAAGSTTPAPAAGSTELDLPIPANSNVYVGDSGPVVTLTGLSQSFAPGQSLDVTMTFEEAGEVPVQVLVGVSTRDLPRGEAFDFHEEKEGVEAGGSGD
jgi:copper(I)-binding protein